MKKIILAISVLFCTAATMTSCNNGDYDADPNTNNAGTKIPSNTGGGNGGGTTSKFDWTGTDPMSAKVDGVAFQATSGTANNTNGYTVVTGSAGLDGSVTVTFPQNTSAGTVITMSGSSFASYQSGSFDFFNSTPGGSGSIKVTENDGSHVKGYFYFKAKNIAGANSVTVSEGYFNVNR